MAQRWSWNLVGLLTTVSIVYTWLAVFVRKLPTPHMSAGMMIGWFFGSLVLSLAAGKFGTRWWYLVSGSLFLTLVAIAGGIAMLER